MSENWQVKYNIRINCKKISSKEMVQMSTLFSRRELRASLIATQMDKDFEHREITFHLDILRPFPLPEEKDQNKSKNINEMTDKELSREIWDTCSRLNILVRDAARRQLKTDWNYNNITQSGHLPYPHFEFKVYKEI